MPSFFANWSAGCSVALLVSLAGCSHYRAKPLTAVTVEQALQAPDLAAVSVAAGSLKHPLLMPLVLDPRQGFTPDEMAVVAVLTSPRLRALRDKRGVAQAQVVQAGLLPNPQLGYSLDLPAGNPGVTGLVSGRSVGLDWEITSLIGRSDRMAGARADAEALKLDIAWEEWQVAQDARLRACRVLSLGERLPLARTMEVDQAENLAAQRTALERHLSSSAEFSAASAAWRQAQTDRIALEQTLSEDRAALRLVLGLRPDAELPLRAATTEDVALAGPGKAEAWVMGLEDRRLDLVALRAGYSSAEAGLRAATKAQFPKIGIGLNRAGDTSKVRTVGVGLTIDLPIFDRNQATIAEAKASRQSLFDDYVARVAEARSEIAQLVERDAQVRTQLAALDADLPALKTHAETAERTLRDGLLDASTAREARLAYATERGEQLRLCQELFELKVALEIASGRTGAPDSNPPESSQ